MNILSKRKTVHLIPYYVQNGECFVFLQKRSQDAERNPDSMSIFGGGVEGDETEGEALVREMKEELNYLPLQPILLGTYEDAYSVSTYYTEKVPQDFESQIRIGEGQYGRFFTKNEILGERLLSDASKKVLNDFFSRMGF